ncbi:hypothetical protein [Cognatilysobacter lacus]|uniref:Uncharacterized protein n=1 Tax=Cognatilysobacter lacus TaxID=1643323 RepID=A0A5D8Z1S4_9GAMM|nr:hypothetical protein [Lysobacter lacus]TZF88506.1 hypothetical protein FW784_09770 [Lysobacter lacus]
MTDETTGYAVFLYEQAHEALGEAIRAYVQDGPGGQHIRCHSLDTTGAFIEMTLLARDARGDEVETELMIPTGMVRMIVSTHSDIAFGFAAKNLEPGLSALPIVGPAAPGASARSSATPQSTGESGPDQAIADHRKPPEG